MSFSRQSVVSPSVLKRVLDLFASPTSFHLVSRRPVACVCRQLQMSPFEKKTIVSAENILQSSARCNRCLPFSFCFEPLRKLLLGNSLFSSEILFGQGILQMHLRGEITRNCHALRTSPITHGMVVHRQKTYLSSRLFVSLSPKNKIKVLTTLVFRSHFSKFLQFSESSTSPAIPDGIAKFRESVYNSSGSRRACRQSKTFPGILIFSRVFRS